MVYIIYDNTGKVEDTAYASVQMIPQGSLYLGVSQEVWNSAQGKLMKVWNGEFIVNDPPPTLQDYDNAMQEHLKTQRVARGYTIREPSDYKGSSVQRWNQDAQDWISHRDAVMLYGLQVMNHYAQTGEAPSLEDFKASLPVISWTYEEQE